MAFDGEKFGGEVVGLVKSYFEREIAPLRERLAAVEARPVIKYLGVWEERREYPAGSLVTRSGSLWHANEATKTSPGERASAWVMVVKQGTFQRDGR